MKIVLIRPPEFNRVWAGIPYFFNGGIFLFPPLGLMQLKAQVEKYSTHEVIIYDSLIHRSGYKNIEAFIKKVSPQLVGISTFTHSLLDVVETAKAIKEVNSLIHIVIGGPHTYAFPEESGDLLSSRCIDSIVLGDGEETFMALLKALDSGSSFEGIAGIIYKDNSGKVIRTGDPIHVDNLDTLAFPSRNIYKAERYYTPASNGYLMTTMITGRGCPYTCKFCNTNKNYRVRSVKNVVDEIELCIRMGYKEVFFIDDTFNVTTARVIELSEEILKRKLKIKWGFKGRCDNVNQELLSTAKRAGCFRIHYGVETGLPLGLVSIDKKVTLDIIKRAFSQTKENGIRTTAYFMIGCPHEKTVSEVMETIDFAVSLKADFAVFSLFSPYPDTEFYRNGVKTGVLDRRSWDAFIKGPACRDDLPTCWEEYFSKKDLVSLLQAAHRKFYYRPRIILNALFSASSVNAFLRMIRGGISLIKLEFFNNGDL